MSSHNFIMVVFSGVRGDHKATGCPVSFISEIWTEKVFSDYLNILDHNVMKQLTEIPESTLKSVSWLAENLTWSNNSYKGKLTCSERKGTLTTTHLVLRSLVKIHRVTDLNLVHSSITWPENEQKLTILTIILVPSAKNRVELLWLGEFSQDWPTNQL